MNNESKQIVAEKVNNQYRKTKVIYLQIIA